MAEFTPGPWRIEGRRGAGYIISAGVNSYGDGPESYVGVLDPMFYVAGEPSRLAADAQLVVAAPKMYEALKLLASVVSGADVALTLLCEDPAAWANVAEALTVAQAALRKATPSKPTAKRGE